MLKPNFWDEPASKEILKERAGLTDQKELLRRLTEKSEEISLYFQLYEEEHDNNLIEDIKIAISDIERELKTAELARLLSEPYDKNNAIFTIHAGAGGTEAQDWADMLFRMYMRWCERRNFKAEIMDYMSGDEAGIKGVTFLVTGIYAYGYLKSETGVHRLVRISPFDASGRRHTSFASVSVAPELDESIEISADEKDIRVDTYRASGAGGQHVNKTSSAVRMTHMPTGIVVQCQNERSQHMNRAYCMKMLLAKLYEREKQKKDEEKSKISGEKKDIGWGSQIRSYTLQPYRLIKDHRTNIEIGNVNAVLDGDIDPFIEAYLSQKAMEG